MKKNYLKVIVVLFILLFICCSSCKGCNKDGDEDNITVEKVEIKNNLESMYVGETITLEASVYPFSLSQEVIWTADSDIVSIDNNILTGKKEGTATITATSSIDKNISSSITISVEKVMPSSIDIRYAKDTIYIGEELVIDSFIYPEYASQEVVLSILDDKPLYEVGIVEGNVLKGLDEGTIYLTVSSLDNQKVFKKITIKVLHECLEEESYEAKAIVGSFGEDAKTMYNIHYQINNTKSYALVTTSDDSEFNNAVKYYGEGYYYKEIDEKTGSNFEARNVWNIVVDNLKPDTEYIYKINNGNDTYSKVYSFKTAGGDNTTFLFFTDTHYYAKTDGSSSSAAVSEELIKNAKLYNPDISFILHGGDMIDSGGDDNIWDIFFSCAKSLETLPYVGVPGNHEYYTSGTTMSDNRYFKIFSAGPKNGPATLKESACWFIHNETLFILVDNVRTFSYNEQLSWMADLLENKEYKYSVVCFHYPVNLETTDYDENFINIFDKYSVDLVLDGHYHSESMRMNYYNNEQTNDPHLGTTYLAGSFSGIKSASSADNAINEAKGYIIDITDDGINIQTIYANGSLAKSWFITNRAGEEVIPASKEELLGSISYEFLEETNQVKFDWSNKFYGNVKKVYITEVLREEIKDYVVFPSSSYTSIILNDVIFEYDYNFEFKIVFEDGSIETLYFKENLHTPLNLNLESTSSSINVSYDEVNESMKYIVKKISIYVNGELYATYSYLNGFTATLSYDIYNLTSNTSYQIKVSATTMAGKEIFSEEKTIKTE